MTTIEIARRMAQLGEAKEALRAYALALGGDVTPGERFEAALYTLQNEGDYRLAYTAFVQLYNEGFRRADVMDVMTRAFYEPNVKPLRSRYERNCKLLAKYPYLFRRDFPAFDDLPLRFFPYDDHGGYVPYDKREDEFLGYADPNEPVVRRNFFRDLEKPVLAEDVFSQYELEYLNDNVRKSEWVGRENHIYLHYADWGTFCAWLQIWNLKPLLEDEKLVFLIGDEVSRYPIDFKTEYGIDYARCGVEPFHIREINKLIWHTQLSAHNGGDFFNEIFDYHPNLLSGTSMMMERVESVLARARERLAAAKSPEEAREALGDWDLDLARELWELKGLTDKDVLVAIYLRDNAGNPAIDRASRIVPALFLQPHFSNVAWNTQETAGGELELTFGQADYARTSQMFRGFRYVKTFSPIRRPTTSSAASVRYMWWNAKDQPEGAPENAVVCDEVKERVLNRSDLRETDNRCYRDAVLVRFEDGKTNPRATFSALAAFLDLPYTESMTYGSIGGRRDPYQMGEAYQNGFMMGPVDNTYDEFLGRAERVLLEYFLRDLYERCGYDFRYWDGAPLSAAALDALCADCATLDGYIRESHRLALGRTHASAGEKRSDEELAQEAEGLLEELKAHRHAMAALLQRGVRFVDRHGKPLEPTPLLALDETLLERPLYR